MSSKGRVIAATVLHMEDQRSIKNKSFKRSVALVGSQHTQYILCGRQLRVGAMNIKAVITKIVIVGMISIYR